MKLRFAPCPVPGCPEMEADCSRHRRGAWGGRTGVTRRQALGVSERSWRRLVAAARRRDGGRCRRCRRPGTEVDHLVPTAWRRPPHSFAGHLAGLMLLCSLCHRAKTRREAALARTWGSPPPPERIAEHVQWWLVDCVEGTRAAL